MEGHGGKPTTTRQKAKTPQAIKDGFCERKKPSDMSSKLVKIQRDFSSMLFLKARLFNKFSKHTDAFIKTESTLTGVTHMI